MSAVAPLFIIAADKAALLDEIVDVNGELTPELEARLAQLDGDFSAKLAACATFVRNLTAEAEKHQAEADRQQALATARLNSATSLKAYMHRCMVAAGSVRVEGVARLQKKPASVVVAVEPATLPVAFQRITIEANKIALRAAWERGERLPDGVSIDTAGLSLRLI